MVSDPYSFDYIDIVTHDAIEMEAVFLVSYRNLLSIWVTKPDSTLKKKSFCLLTFISTWFQYCKIIILMPVSFVCIVTSRNSSEHFPPLGCTVDCYVVWCRQSTTSFCFIFFKQLTFTEETARPGVSEFGIVFSSQFSNSRLGGM